MLNGSSQHSKLIEKIPNPTDLLAKVFQNLSVEVPLDEVKRLVRNARLWCLLSYGKKSPGVRKKFSTLHDLVENEYLTENEMKKLGSFQQSFMMEEVGLWIETSLCSLCQKDQLDAEDKIMDLFQGLKRSIQSLMRKDQSESLSDIIYKFVLPIFCGVCYIFSFFGEADLEYSWYYLFHKNIWVFLVSSIGVFLIYLARNPFGEHILSINLLDFDLEYKGNLDSLYYCWLKKSCDIDCSFSVASQQN